MPARTIGHKIGLTSRAMQIASKMTEPDYGHLLDDMLYDDGALAPLDACLEPGQIVLAGSFTRPVSIATSDVIHADYGPLGAIGVSLG